MPTVAPPPAKNPAVFVFFPTDFGRCGIAWNERGLTGFRLPVETGLPARIDEGEPAGAQPPAWVRRVIERVQEHLHGHLQDFADVRLDWTRVSDFQRAVYEQAQTISPGGKRSYGEIARALALGPAGARAVGAALAANPWPLLVPCHRVVSADGKMTGFSAPGGIRTKTRLLAIEGAELLSE